MNKRIREMYETALVAAGKDKQFETTNLDVATKFAELIVKETMQVVANNLPQNTYLDVADAVIEYFKE